MILLVDREGLGLCCLHMLEDMFLHGSAHINIKLLLLPMNFCRVIFVKLYDAFDMNNNFSYAQFSAALSQRLPGSL